MAHRAARIVPTGLRRSIKEMWTHVDAARARRRWDRAAPTGPLRADALPAMAARFPVIPSTYNYTPDDLLARGLERYEQLAPDVPAGGATLEIGSADGMIAGVLASHGRIATAIDIDISRTDPRALATGAHVIEMDATRLDFPDESFDLVYSFNAFEHLSDPAATFAEVTRVLRPEGVASISFTGLRWSPHGAHLYKAIGIPYVTVLFEEADVLSYLESTGQPTRAPWVNDYSIERFRAGFADQADNYSVWQYGETRNCWHAGLIARHAGVFKTRAPSFESLLVDSVRLWCRKYVGPHSHRTDA